MNRRSNANERSSRSSSSSKVSASSFNSSSGPARFRRSCRLLAEISFVVAVIVRSGRRKRPATNQPSTSEAPAIIARAVPEATRSWSRSELCSVTPLAGLPSLGTGVAVAVRLPVVSCQTSKVTANRAAPEARKTAKNRRARRTRIVRRGRWGQELAPARPGRVGASSVIGASRPLTGAH